jgi:spermidine synthase
MNNNDLYNWNHLRYEEMFHGGETGIFIKIKELIYSKQSEFQRIDIFDSYNVGRVFALDGITQTMEKYEFMYHEMLVHVAMFAHPNPKRVLIIGGGDGGTLRETLKHQSIEQVDMCEIDEEVVLAAKEYLPKLSYAMEDSRANLMFRDGAAYVAEFDNHFDVIIIDSTDPTAGEGGNLFTETFYENCKNALTEDGILVAHTENPVYDTAWLEMAHSRIKSVFETTKLYTGFSPQYPSGFWTYTIGSKTGSPENRVREDKKLEAELEYYTPEIHRASFALPVFLKRIVDSL